MFIRELHAHITGTVPSSSIFDIIEDNIDKLDKNKLNELVPNFVQSDPYERQLAFVDYYHCFPNGKKRFNEVMQRFMLIHFLLESVPDIKSELGELAALAMKLQGVNYVEWRLDPFSGTNGTAEKANEKAREFYNGLSRVNIESKLIIGIAKHRYTDKDKIEYLKVQLRKFLDHTKDLPIVALDAVNEEKVSIKDLSEVLKISGDYGLGLVPHVGEMTSSTLEENFQTVEDALLLKSKRLGHAIVAYANLGKQYISRQNELLHKIKESGACIEVCPTSNLVAHLGLKYYKEHPIKRLIEWEIPFIVSSDDYGIFNSTIDEEIDKLKVDRNKVLGNMDKYSFA